MDLTSTEKKRKQKKDDPYKYFRDKKKQEQGLSISDPEEYMSEENSSDESAQEIIMNDTTKKANYEDVSSFKDSSEEEDKSQEDQSGEYSDPDYELSVSKKKDSPLIKKKEQNLPKPKNKKQAFASNDIDSNSSYSDQSDNKDDDNNFSIHLENSKVKKPSSKQGDFANKGSVDQSDSSDEESSEKYTNHSRSQSKKDDESFSVNEVTTSTKKKVVAQNKKNDVISSDNEISSDEDIKEDSIQESGNTTYSQHESSQEDQKVLSSSIKKSGEHLTFSAHSVAQDTTINQNNAKQGKTQTNAMSLVGDTMVNNGSVVQNPKIVNNQTKTQQMDQTNNDFDENDIADQNDQDLQKKSVEEIVNGIPSRFPKQPIGTQPYGNPNFKVTTTKSNKTSNANANKDLTGIISPDKKTRQTSQAKSNAILNKRPGTASSSKPRQTAATNATTLKPKTTAITQQMNVVNALKKGQDTTLQAKKPRPPTANVNRAKQNTVQQQQQAAQVKPRLTKEEDQLKAKIQFNKVQEQKAKKDQKIGEKIAKNLAQKKIIGKDEFDYKQANKDLGKFKLDHNDAKDWFNDVSSEDEIQAQAKQQQQQTGVTIVNDAGSTTNNKKAQPATQKKQSSQPPVSKPKVDPKRVPSAKQQQPKKPVSKAQDKKKPNQDLENLKSQKDDQDEDDGGLFDEEKAESGDQALAPQDKSDNEGDNDLFNEEEAESGDQALFQASNANSMSQSQVSGSASQVSKNKSIASKSAISKKSVSSAAASTVAKKKPPTKDAKPKKHGWGWNGLASVTESQKARDDEAKKQKEAEAKEKFRQIKAEQKAKGDDPNIMAALLNNQKKDKEFKEKDKVDNINSRVKDFKIGEDKKGNGQADGKEKMPVDAALLNDDEKLKKQISDLKKEFKELFNEHKQVSENVEVGEKKTQETKTALEKTMKEKRLILVNGKFQMHDPEAKNQRVAKQPAMNLLDIPEYDKIAEKESFMEAIVKSFEENGYTAKQAYDMLDYDGDQVLTLEEIKDGLKHQKGLKLKDSEYNELIKIIDEDGDGVLTEEEWVNLLHPKVEAQHNYEEIMQGIEIKDPLELQVQTLNMVYEIKMLETDLHLLQKAQGSIEQVRQKKEDMKKRSQEMAQKVKEAEQKAKDKKAQQEKENDEVESKIRKRVLDKNSVHDQLIMIQEEYNQNDIDHHNAIKEVLADLNLYEVQHNDKFVYNEKLKRQLQDVTRRDDRQTYLLKQAQDLEASLDKTIEEILGRAITGNDLQMLYQMDLKMLNQLQTNNPKIKGFMRELAASNIQRIWRGGKARLFAKLLFVQQKDTKAKLTEFLKKRKAKQELNACLLLQRQWRIFKQRKIQLEKIQEENHIRRKSVMSKYSQEELKKVQENAVNLIIKHWKEYKSSNKMKMSNFARSVHQSMSMGKTLSVVEFKKLVMCQICKKVRGERVCPGCGDQVYCEEHFKLYHSKGSRRTHSYNRIKYTMGSSANIPLNDTMNTASFGKDNSFVREQVGMKHQDDSDASDDFGRA